MNSFQYNLAIVIMNILHIIKFKHLILVLILMPIMLFSQPSFFWQHPLPSGNQMNTVRFVDQSTGFAVGDLGTILKTTNAGVNWTQQNSPINASLLDLYCINLSTVVITGTLFGNPTNNGIILKSTNSGDTWNIINNQTNATYRRIDFPSGNVGYIAGAGVILKSTDAGSSWVQQPSAIGNFYSIDFYDENVGCAGGTNRLMLTTNGGLNWTLQNIKYNSVLDQVVGVVQANPNTVLGTINSTNGESLITTNNGTNWTKHSMNIPISVGGNVDIVKNIKIINNTSFAVTDFGRILKSTNSGVNWSIDSTTFKPPFPMPFILWNLDMINENSLYITGGGGFIAHTSNSGINWNTQIGYQRNLRNVYFPSSNIGYSVGEGGTILKTTNEGQNWHTVSSVSSRHLQSAYFTNANTGFIVGDTGLIMKTTNSGINWNIQQSGTLINLLSVKFTDSNTGYTAGSYINNGNSVILKTTNAGNNWVTKFTGNGMELQALFFTNETTGYSVGDEFYKTTNSGENWVLKPTARGRDVCFSDASNGYVIGFSTTLFKTTDGGENWSSINYAIPGPFESINFFGNFGIASGDRGTIMKTTNGGFNWTAINSPTNNFLYSIYFLNENIGYIAGNFGTIIKTTNGGLSFIQANNGIVPKKFSLHQNFPNPFNPSTKIKFDVPQNVQGITENIKITVFDIQGSEIAVLIDEELSPGVYEIEFNATDISSGIYFYSIQTKNHSDTKRMVLLK